jgi:hypothetical protein
MGQRWRFSLCWAPVGLIALVRIPVAAVLSPGVIWIPGRPRMASWCYAAMPRPLEPLSCPVDQACLNSICWPLLCNYRAAQRSGDSAAMLGIR